MCEWVSVASLFVVAAEEEEERVLMNTKKVKIIQRDAERFWTTTLKKFKTKSWLGRRVNVSAVEASKRVDSCWQQNSPEVDQS